MTFRLVRPTLLALASLYLAGCSSSYEHERVISADQGRIVVERVHDEPPPAPAPAPTVPTGPSDKEIAQQRRIDQLEAKQKALQTEIEQLKHEQTNPK